MEKNEDTMASVQESLNNDSDLSPHEPSHEIRFVRNTERLDIVPDTAPSETTSTESNQVVLHSSLEDIIIVLPEDDLTEDATLRQTNVNDQPPLFEENINAVELAIPTEVVKDKDQPVFSGIAHLKQPKRWAYKNVCGIGISMVLVYTAFIGLQNLQSSINSTGGLGLVSLSVLYIFFVISAFVNPTILKIFGTKYSILIGYLGQLQYTIANYYPSWYTLIPSSALNGFGCGPIWAASNSHIAEVATTLAPLLNKDQSYLIGKFCGMFFFFFQWAQVSGNLASSLILYPYNRDTSENSSGTGEDEQSCSIQSNTTIDQKYLYILASVYVVFIVTGIIVLLTLVDKIPTRSGKRTSGKKLDLYLKEPLKEIALVLTSAKMVILAPAAVMNGLELSFAFGLFPKIYINDCFGTYQVGFTLMVLGASSAIMSYVYGRIMKYIPRIVLVLFGATLNVSLLLFLLIWERVPSYTVIYTFVVGWGMANAVWNTTSCTLIGILFPDRANSAFSAQKFWLAIGFTLGFISAEVLSPQACFCITLAAVLLGVLCYIIIEIIFRPDSSSHCLCYHRKQRKEINPTVTSRESETNPTLSPYQNSATGYNPTFERDSLDGTFPVAEFLEVIEESLEEVTTTGSLYCTESNTIPATFECDSLDGTFPS